MKEIEMNKKAWRMIAKDHYNTFYQALKKEENLLNNIIIKEIGDVKNKSILHLQCNTGADSISLARMGAKKVTGVDLVPENIFYAKKLARNSGVNNIDFIESDIMYLIHNHTEKYDIVFTSEGSIGWLPDLAVWGKTIRYFLSPEGFFYILDSHPFLLSLDEQKLKNNELSIKYPYFNKIPDEDTTIGGYASKPKKARNYFWMYTVSDIINSLVNAGLSIEFFNEYDKLFYDMGEMERIEKGLFHYPHLRGKLPFIFSLKATVKK